MHVPHSPSGGIDADRGQSLGGMGLDRGQMAASMSTASLRELVDEMVQRRLGEADSVQSRPAEIPRLVSGDLSSGSTLRAWDLQ